MDTLATRALPTCLLSGFVSLCTTHKIPGPLELHSSPHDFAFSGYPVATKPLFLLFNAQSFRLPNSNACQGVCVHFTDVQHFYQVDLFPAVVSSVGSSSQLWLRWQGCHKGFEVWLPEVALQ